LCLCSLKRLWQSYRSITADAPVSLEVYWSKDESSWSRKTQGNESNGEAIGL
jgi:hypothetical protein